MNNETTNRKFEDTNVAQKKIIARTEDDMGTPVTVSGFNTYNVVRDIDYQQTGTNNYAFDAFLDYHVTAFNFYVRPANYCQLNPTTGKMTVEYIATMSSFADPSGNYVQLTYTLGTGEVPFAINFKSFGILYSTSITEEAIW